MLWPWLARLLKTLFKQVFKTRFLWEFSPPLFVFFPPVSFNHREKCVRTFSSLFFCEILSTSLNVCERFLCLIVFGPNASEEVPQIPFLLEAIFCATVLCRGIFSRSKKKEHQHGCVTPLCLELSKFIVSGDWGMKAKMRTFCPFLPNCWLVQNDFFASHFYANTKDFRMVC